MLHDYGAEQMVYKDFIFFPRFPHLPFLPKPMKVIRLNYKQAFR
jgi:hypothetical protein